MKRSCKTYVDCSSCGKRGGKERSLKSDDTQDVLGGSKDSNVATPQNFLSARVFRDEVPVGVFRVTLFEICLDASLEPWWNENPRDGHMAYEKPLWKCCCCPRGTIWQFWQHNS